MRAPDPPAIWPPATCPLAPGLLLLLAGLSAVRAGEARGSPATRLAEAGAFAALGEAPLAQGRFASSPRGGQLEGEQTPLVPVPGSVRPGELVAALSVQRVTLGPRGPEDSSTPVVRAKVTPDELVRLRPGAVPLLDWLAAPFEAWRQRGLARVARLRDPLTRGLVAALVFGDRSQLPRGVSDLFVRTGTRHMLALSGLHVGLLAWMLVRPLGAALARLFAGLVGLLSPAAAQRVPAQLFQALLLLLLVPLGGGGAPVLRAAIALSLATLAPRLRSSARAGPDPGRRVDGLSLLAFALAFECLADPRSPFDVSVQLSYAATFGLLVGASRARRWIASLLPGGAQIAMVGKYGRERPALVRLPLQKLIGGTLGAIAASCVAMLATLPITWTTFGEVSAAGPLATLVSLPFIAFLLFAGWVHVLVPDLVAPELLELASALLARTLDAMDTWPGTPLPLPPRPIALLAVCSACALAGRARLAQLGFGALLLPWALAPAGFELITLDVGHGTACIARAPGEPAILFDAGSRDRPGIARNGVAPILRAWDVTEIDVVLSHSHRDHAGSLSWIAERWKPRLWAGARVAHPRVRLPHDCLRLDLEEGSLALPTRRPDARPALSLRLLRGSQEPGNEGSRSLELTYDRRRFLLTGDAEGIGLARSLEAGTIRGPVEVLLLPHHGSESRFLGPLLDVARPSRVWISVAQEPPVLPELARRGLPHAWTGAAGALRWARAP